MPPKCLLLSPIAGYLSFHAISSVLCDSQIAPVEEGFEKRGSEEGRD